MSTFESVRQAREDGFNVCRIDPDGSLQAGPAESAEVPVPAGGCPAPSTFWFPAL